MASKARLPVRERRGANRPSNGDLKVCPACGSSCEFNERYRFDGGMAPAWRCDSPQCQHAELVRSGPSGAASRQLIRKAKQAQAAAKRTLMKARAVHQPSKKIVSDAEHVVSRSRRRDVKGK